jgi:hypothetical protein
MQEQRLTLRLLRYWELVRKNKPYPEYIHFNTAAIEEIWPWCFVVSVGKRKRAAYTYEYMGEPVAKLYGHNLTGMTIDYTMTQFPGGVIHKKLPEVVEAAVPMTDDGHFVSAEQGLIKYRACYLPFGNKKNGITHIIVGISCRKFA